LTSARHKKEMAAAPAPVDGITADSLTPTELGHLCGGAQHAAETALADLYLRGQLRRESEESSLFALTEAGSGSPVGDPVRDDIAHALRTQGSWNLDDLIDIGQDGAGMGHAADRVRRQGAARRHRRDATGHRHAQRH